MDRITANLPARDFEETWRFYETLGFETTYRDEGWMVLKRGPLEIEFFLYRDLVPGESWFSACVRVEDGDALYDAWSRVGLPSSGIPRMTAARDEPSGLRIFPLVDPNGSLLRCISNPGATGAG